MGHEAAGYVAAIGAQVTGWREGDRVTFDSTICCGSCPYCLRGEINLCDRRQVLGVSCDDYRCAGAFAKIHPLATLRPFTSRDVNSWHDRENSLYPFRGRACAFHK